MLKFCIERGNALFWQTDRDAVIPLVLFLEEASARGLMKYSTCLTSDAKASGETRCDGVMRLSVVTLNLKFSLIRVYFGLDAALEHCQYLRFCRLGSTKDGRVESQRFV